MDIKNLQVDEEWEWYIGQLFASLIDKSETPQVVVELAPGFRHKIAIALKEIGFAGKIYVIDSNPEVREYIDFKYKQILPNAEVIYISEDFFDAIKLLPNKIDLFLANHAIDDLLLNRYMAEYKKGSQSMPQSSDGYLEIWKSFAGDIHAREKISQEVANLFLNFFNMIDVKNAVISQYRSNLFFLGKDNQIEDVVRGCFDKIKDSFITDKERVINALKILPFGDDERYLGKDLLENTQNEKHWIVGRIKAD